MTAWLVWRRTGWTQHTPILYFLHGITHTHTHSLLDIIFGSTHHHNSCFPRNIHSPTNNRQFDTFPDSRLTAIATKIFLRLNLRHGSVVRLLLLRMSLLVCVGFSHLDCRIVWHDNWDPTEWHALQRGSSSYSLTSNNRKELIKIAPCAPGFTHSLSSNTDSPINYSPYASWVECQSTDTHCFHLQLPKCSLFTVSQFSGKRKCHSKLQFSMEIFHMVQA